MSNPPSPKRLKVVVAAPSANYGTILELALPFVPVVEDEIFPHLSLVSKDLHGQCLDLLRRFCKENHPVLLEVVGRNGSPDKLTYGRYRRFLLTESESRIPVDDDNGDGDNAPAARDEITRLADYEMVLEMSSLPGAQHRIHVWDIQPLEYRYGHYGEKIQCQFQIPCAELVVKQRPVVVRDQCRVRICLRHKSSGKMAIVMNQPSSRHNRVFPQRKMYEDLYGTKGELAHDMKWDMSVWVPFFWRAETEDTLIGTATIPFEFWGDTDDIESDDEVDDNRAELVDYLFRAMDAWTWF